MPIDPFQVLSSIQLCAYQQLATGLIPRYKTMVTGVNNLLQSHATIWYQYVFSGGVGGECVIVQDF